MRSWYRILKNAVDFPIRQAIRWRRGAPEVHAADKADAFPDLSGAELSATQDRAKFLIQKYGLEEFAVSSNMKHYTINLFYLDMLETAFGETDINLSKEAPLTVADVGPGAWSYAPAFYSFLRIWNAPSMRTVEIRGFEIDAYRVFNDLRSRFDHAQGHIRNLTGMEYCVGPFTATPERYDLVTLFFPFVLIDDHLDWGLPQGLFQPSSLLKDAWMSLKPGGVLFVANQGAEEFAEQKRLLDALGASTGPSMRFESNLHAYEIPRYTHIRTRD